MSTSNPFGDNPFDPSAATHSPAASAPPPTTAGPGEVNTLATLSVVFAFVFAPAGAILGHLGLSQIARTRQRGRERALVGVTLSYVVITAAVVALVVWASTRHIDTRPAIAAPTTSASAARPVPTSAPPPPPTVAPADVAALLPNLQQVRDLTGNQAVTEGPTSREMAPSTVTVDRPECVAVLASGAAPAYNPQAVRGYLDSEFLDLSNAPTWLALGLDAVGFEQPAGARAQLDDLLAQWKRCVTGTAEVHYPDGRTYTASFTPPTDAGDGITTMEVRLSGLPAVTVRAIATKANVIVDIFLQTKDADHARTLTVMKSILAKIPG
jgi:eukaryotic-like serine/threonine-protein kinase